MKLFAPALATLLMLGAAAHAADKDSAAAQAADSDDADARLAAARDLLKASKSLEIQEIRIDLVVDRARVAFRHQPGVSDAEATEYASILREELERDSAKLVDLRAKYYADHFSVAELKEWTRVRETPLGQKLTAAEPELLRSMVAVDDAWLATAMQRTQARYTAAHTNGATHL
jgi:hypothetical protein